MIDLHHFRRDERCGPQLVGRIRSRVKGVSHPVTVSAKPCGRDRTGTEDHEPTSKGQL